MSRRGTMRGSVLLIVVFIIALLSATVMGMLEISTEEIQVMQNEVYATEALATAEAGIEDALQYLLLDKNWDDGFSAKAFNGGTYTVTVDGHNKITAVGTTARGYSASMYVEFKATWRLVAYAVKINKVRINGE